MKQPISAKNFWMIYWGGIAFLLLSLPLYYVGEESIFPISSQEMWFQGVWLKQLMLGGDVFHPPLFNWLIAGLSSLTGWPHVKEAARIITIAATAGTGLTLAWLALRLTRDRMFSALAAVCYLTFQDVLLYHGWLAYVDPLFGFFIFLAIALIWVAAHEQNRLLLVLSALAITGAFMSKALTAYIFFGSAIFVLLLQRDTRRFLLNPVTMLILLAAFAYPLFWYRLQGGSGSSYMLSEIMSKLTGGGGGKFDLSGYMVQRLSFLLETLTELFPAAWLALYLLLRKKVLPGELPDYIRTGGWIALLCYLPYLLSPQSGIRYLLPVYPLFALFAAGIILQAGETWMAHARRWMLGMLALQLVLFLGLFPYYQSHYRGENYFHAAQEIAQITKGQEVYSNSVTSYGLIVLADLNALRYPQPPLQRPPQNWANGFLITHMTDIPETGLVKKFQLAADTLYLLCRGTACSNSQRVTAPSDSSHAS